MALQAARNTEDPEKARRVIADALPPILESRGFSYKRLDFTTYVFTAVWTNPTVVLATGFKF
jgi:hypothetical protein